MPRENAYDSPLIDNGLQWYVGQTCGTSYFRRRGTRTIIPYNI